MKKVKSLLSLILAILMVAGCVVSASAAAKVEAEPNGTAATATEFKVGEEISGKLEDSADEDYFKFTAAKAGNATVTVKHTAKSAESTYFAVVIQDAAEKTLTSFTSAGNKTEASAVVSVAKDATYYVVITEGDICDPTLEYTISVSVAEVALSESEPNNKVSEADTLEYSPSGNPKEYYGSISAGDEDYYKVAIPSNGVINLYLYNYAANAGDYTAIFYTYLEEGGMQVLRPVTTIQITKAESSKTGASVGVEKGEYYLVVKGTDGSTGSYKTRVLFRAADYLETEWNDTTATADVIAFGKTYKATIDEKGDKDYFKFTVPANNNGYDFAFVSTNAGDWYFRILNSDGINVIDPVALKATNDNKTAKGETNALAEGTYYIEVFAGDVHDAGYYDIKVTEKAAAAADDKEEEKNLLDRIGALNWGGLWDNFSGWIEEINFIGLLGSIFGSIMKLFTYFGSMA